LSAAAFSAAAFSAATFAAAAARASTTLFDSDCSIHSSFPASVLVQMKTFGGYFSVAFSVRQADEAGAVALGVGTAVADAESLTREELSEAADWPPQAVAEITTATAKAPPATRRREIHDRFEVRSAWPTSLSAGFRASLRGKSVFIYCSRNSG
jgi:hypothetical protein